MGIRSPVRFAVAQRSSFFSSSSFIFQHFSGLTKILFLQWICKIQKTNVHYGSVTIYTLNKTNKKQRHKVITKHSTLHTKQSCEREIHFSNLFAQ